MITGLTNVHGGDGPWHHGTAPPGSPDTKATSPVTSTIKGAPRKWRGRREAPVGHQRLMGFETWRLNISYNIRWFIIKYNYMFKTL